MDLQDLINSKLIDIQRKQGIKCGCLSCHLERLLASPKAKNLTVGDYEKAEAVASYVRQMTESVELVMNGDPKKIDDIIEIASREGYKVMAKIAEEYKRAGEQLRALSDQYNSERDEKDAAMNEATQSEE